jgi:sugar/nucleoside kinase (ribokinase family)
MKYYDVYAYGVIASSELHLLSVPFPSPDGYAEIAETHFMTGGEALNSAIVLSRLGLSVQLDGNWIGDTPAGESLLAIIRGYGIDTQRLRIEKGFSGV